MPPKLIMAPIVFLDRAPPGIGLDSVTIDNVKGAQDGVRHLLRSGHRDIAIITGSLALEIGRARLAGYEAALNEAGIKIRRSLILEGDFREESGYRLGKEILVRQHRPTALFVCNGVMTLGVLGPRRPGLRCPQDLGLPHLTTFLSDAPSASSTDPSPSQHMNSALRERAVD